MMTFKQFFLAENTMVRQLPELMHWAREFFRHRMDTSVLKIYGDWLYDQGPQYEEAAQLFQAIGGEFRDPRRKSGPWRGQLIGPFHNVFRGASIGAPTTHRYDLNDNMANAWLIVRREDGQSQGRNHYIYENMTSYRLSLTNGQWSSYTNNDHYRVCVISTRHIPGPADAWLPQVRITIKNYAPIDVDQVPDDVVLFAFYNILEKQIRGGH